MTKLTIEMVNDLDMTWVPYGKSKTVTDTHTGTVWVFVSEEHLGYDEGTVTTQYVWKNRETDELWAFEHETNSWADGYCETSTPYKVKSEQKMITVYTKL